MLSRDYPRFTFIRALFDCIFVNGVVFVEQASKSNFMAFQSSSEAEVIVKAIGPYCHNE